MNFGAFLVKTGKRRLIFFCSEAWPQHKLEDETWSSEDVDTFLVLTGKRQLIFFLTRATIEVESFRMPSGF